MREEQCLSQYLEIKKKMTKKFLLIIFMLFMSLLFVSCSTVSDPEIAFFENSYKKEFDSIAKDFCPFIKNKTIVVTDLVDIQKFVPNKEGIFLSEYLKNSLINECNSKIIQVEFSKHFKISDEGFRILTRKIDDLRQKNVNTSLIVTGTYKKTENKVILFIRLVDYKTSKIKKFAIKEIKFYKPYGLF